MTEELRTLKDINPEAFMGKKKITECDGVPVFSQGLYLGEDLRLEAIKWMKAINERKELEFGCCRITTGDNICHSTEGQALYYWIKHFFTISEKDLEDEE